MQNVKDLAKSYRNLLLFLREGIWLKLRQESNSRYDAVSRSAGWPHACFATLWLTLSMPTRSRSRSNVSMVYMWYVLGGGFKVVLETSGETIYCAIQHARKLFYAKSYSWIFTDLTVHGQRCIVTTGLLRRKTMYTNSCIMKEFWFILVLSHWY